MTLALQTLIDQWMIPRMNARIIRAEAFLGNKGSVRVFEKCGFVEREQVEHDIVVPCGERYYGYHVLWWKYDNRRSL